MTIIGISNTINFKGSDGTEIEGKNIFFTYPLGSKQGAGMGSEKHFFTTSKISQFDFQPEIGDEVSLLFNRYGKVAEIKRDRERTLDL